MFRGKKPPIIYLASSRLQLLDVDKHAIKQSASKQWDGRQIALHAETHRTKETYHDRLRLNAGSVGFVERG